MAFGSEAVVPVEVELLNHRTTNFDEQQNQEELRTDLDLLEEKRDKASQRIAVYQQRMARYYNSTVKAKTFQPGDLVLRKVDPTGQRIGKLGPNWEGPYQVVAQSRPGAYRLTTLKGRGIPNSWNAEHLKPYYK